MDVSPIGQTRGPNLLESSRKDPSPTCVAGRPRAPWLLPQHKTPKGRRPPCHLRLCPTWLGDQRAEDSETGLLGWRDGSKGELPLEVHRCAT